MDNSLSTEGKTPEEAKSVRGAALRELARFYQENDKDVSLLFCCIPHQRAIIFM